MGIEDLVTLLLGVAIGAFVVVWLQKLAKKIKH